MHMDTHIRNVGKSILLELWLFVCSLHWKKQ